MLLGISPMIGPRLLVCSDCTIADLQGFILLVCLPSQQTRLSLRLGVLRAVDKRCAVCAAKVHFPYHTVLWIGVREP